MVFMQIFTRFSEENEYYMHAIIMVDSVLINTIILIQNKKHYKNQV